MKKTKIVCTIGPSSSSREMLKALMEAGMDVARLNFSHGTYEDHKKVFDAIRELALEINKPIAILQDLCGPKIRTGNIANEPINLIPGNEIILTTREVPGDANEISISYEGLPADLKPDNIILIDDGLLELRVLETNKTDIKCRVITGGPLLSHKGINVPGVKLSISSITEKDIKDLHFGIDIGVDYVAISFVRSAEDILQIKEEMGKRDVHIPVIAKIEKHEAITELEKILQVADGIMVARGDLGVEVPMEEVPLIQKMLIKRCNEISKPVITATQMLDSMIRNPRPTRAEVTDVANAIFDGTDAIMLSGETASGKYPLESVKMMATIAEYVEKSLPSRCHETRMDISPGATEAISLATSQMAEELKAKAILVSTSSGRTAKVISKYKPKAPILAATSSPETIRRLALSWGVFPLKVSPTPDTDEMMEEVSSAALSSRIVKEGDLVIFTGGIPAGIQGSTNMIKVHIMGHLFVRGIGVGEGELIEGIVRKATNPEEALKRVVEGDILVVPRVEEGYGKVSSRIRGIISIEGQADSPSARMVHNWGVPAIFGVPQAMEIFTDNKPVTLDISRGLIYHK